MLSIRKNKTNLVKFTLLGVSFLLLFSCESRFSPFTKPKLTKSTVSGSGNINVTSTPNFASVYLDDSYKGSTPLTIYGVEVGPHDLKVTYTGYNNYTTTCDVYNNQTTYVSATLVQTVTSDTYEPDNSFSQYKTISPASYSQSQNRSLYPGGDYDYIRFYGYSGRTYTFYSTGNTDTRITLYNSAQSFITSDDDSGDGSNFRLQWNCTSSGYYYLVIRGYSSSTTGNYTFYYYYSY